MARAVQSSAAGRCSAAVRGARWPGLRLRVLATATAAEPLCPHEDATKRRAEWKQHRAAAERAAPSPSRKWHEATSSMIACRSADEYRALVQRAASERKLLVAKFFTEDCYVCRTLHPKIRSMAEAEHSDVLWAKLNGSDPDTVTLFQSLGVSKVPLFHVVRDGQLVAELTTSLSPEKLAAFRRELARHKHAMMAAPSSPSPPSPLSSTDAASPQQQQQQQWRRHDDSGAEAADVGACEPASVSC